MLWRAIDWKGEFSHTPEKEKPSDQQFHLQIGKLLNPSGLEDEWPDPSVQAYIAALDDPISKQETKFVIEKQLKPIKGAGPDGISPGIFHFIPATWLTFLSMLLNVVFSSNYPQS